MNDIVLLIMESGEHIIGEKVGSDDTGSISLKNPVSLAPDPNSGGRSMMFIPYLQFCVEDTAPFPKATTRHQLTPRSELIDGYKQQFGAGIITPNQNFDPGAGAGMRLV